MCDSAVIFDLHIEKKWSERHCGTHAHTLKHCYHRSYTSERGQGSVWNWVKETGDVTSRRESKSRKE